MRKSVHLFNIILIPIVVLAGSSPAVSIDSETVNSGAPGSMQTAEIPKQEDEAIRVSLKSVADSAHHLQATLRDIVYEITRQRYVTAAEPNVVGPIVVPAMPQPTGQIAMGDYLPPRQKYMTNFTAQAQTLLNMLVEEASVLPSADSTDSDLSSEISLIKKDLDYMRAQNQSLQSLSAGPSYENLAIGHVVIQMSDKLDEIKKLLKEAEHRINKDIKHDPA